MQGSLFIVCVASLIFRGITLSSKPANRAAVQDNIGQQPVQSLEVAASGLQPVQILGLPNTGTHLLLDSAIQAYTDSTGIAHVENYIAVYKHIVLRSTGGMDELHQQFDNDGVIALAIVRNPLSWLDSMRKAPYQWRPCFCPDSPNEEGECEVTEPTVDWLESDCAMPKSGDAPPYQVIQDSTQLQNVEDWWNWNVHDYSYLSHFGWNRSVVVRYEDLVLTPKEFIQQFESMMGAPAIGKTTPIEDATKGFGNSLDHDEAQLKIKDKSFLERFTEEELRSACSRFDLELMHKWFYHDCDAYVDTMEKTEEQRAEDSDSEDATLEEDGTKSAVEPLAINLSLWPEHA